MPSIDLIQNWFNHDGPSPNSIRGDALPAMLERLRPEAWTSREFDLHVSAGVRIPAAPAALFVMLSGSLCAWSVADPSPVRIDEGDIILFQGDGEIGLAHQENTPLVAIGDVLSRAQVLRQEPIRFGSGARSARFITAAVRFGIDVPPRLVKLLPKVIVQTRDERSATCTSLVSQLERASESGNTRLADDIAAIICLEVWHDHLARSQASEGPPGVLPDPNLGPLLMLLHAHPSREWSAEMMQLESGLSRTALFERFKDYMGCSPTAYIRQIRIQRSKRLLANTEMTIYEIARAIGFRSSGAFCSAFKACIGTTPGKYRRMVKVEGRLRRTPNQLESSGSTRTD